MQCSGKKLGEFKKHLVAALGHLGCFSISIDCNSNLLKCPVNDLPSHSELRNSVFILFFLSFSFFYTTNRLKGGFFSFFLTVVERCKLLTALSRCGGGVGEEA